LPGVAHQGSLRGSHIRRALALARDHTALVCGMNLALLGAVADRVGDRRVAARLESGARRCCVLLLTD